MSQLVQPAIKDRELTVNPGNKRMLAFRNLRRSVARDCIIAIITGDYDHGSKPERGMIAPYLFWAAD